MKADKPNKPDAPVDIRSWKHRFFNEVPMVDKDGKPMQQDPPLNTGFFLKKHDTAGALRDHIESIKTERSQRRSGNQTIRN